MAPLCAIGAFLFNYIKYGKVGVLSCFCLWISVIWAFVGAGITSNKCIHGNCWEQAKFNGSLLKF